MNPREALHDGVDALHDAVLASASVAGVLSRTLCAIHLTDAKLCNEYMFDEKETTLRFPMHGKYVGRELAPFFFLASNVHDDDDGAPITSRLLASSLAIDFDVRIRGRTLISF